MKTDYRKYTDNSVKPGTDFWKYATGKWIDYHPMPKDVASWNNFAVLEEESLLRLKDMLGSLDPSNTMQKKMLDFFYVYTNYEKRNSEGILPMKQYIDDINSFDNKDDMLSYLFDNMLSEIGFSISIGPDEKDSLMNIIYVYQNLTLDNKVYYLSDEPYITDIRNKYIEVSKKILMKFNYSEERADDILCTFMDFETRLAEVANSEEELEIPELNYFKYNIDDLSEEIGYDFRKVLSWCGLNETEELVVCQPKVLKRFFELFGEVTEDEFRDCVLWCIVGDYCTKLSEDFGETEFEYTKFVSGVEERTPRWKRELYKMDSEFGEEFGKIYAQRYFSPEAKQYAIDMFEYIRASFAEIMENQNWMCQETKRIALDKLISMTFKIGYPDKQKDYSDFPVDIEKSYLDNALMLNRYWRDKNIEERYNKPVDLTEWPMLPQDINACYMPVRNEFCFPCGILQAPFFDVDAPDAFNYGAIGMVMAHEMTHGFDASGCKYDKNGNRTNWWTEEDEKNFNELAKLSVEQFDKLDVCDDLKANGTLTLNENIADFGGIEIALNALKMKYSESGVPEDEYDWNFIQEFFIAYANNWAGSFTEESLRDATLNGRHSVLFNRVNGTLPMVDEWYEAFGITEDDKMYVAPEKRAKLWKKY